jgi:putative membrane protein
LSLKAGPGFPVLLLVLYFRYHTLRYEVDAEGITMRWGILFRREVLLTYARIQDIHLTSNLVERWLGLGRIQVQTASGSSSAELTIEGLAFFQEMRDFLYARMRGARAHKHETAALPAAAAGAENVDELTATLRDVAAELRALRTALAERNV